VSKLVRQKIAARAGTVSDGDPLPLKTLLSLPPFTVRTHRRRPAILRPKSTAPDESGIPGDEHAD
jgi:hypothetical protein